MRQRVITGAIAGAFYLLFLWIGSTPFAVLVAAIAVISFLELAAMKRIRRSSFSAVLGAAVTAAIVLSPALNRFQFPFSDAEVLLRLLILFALLLLATTVFSGNVFQFEQTAFLFFSSFYIGFSFYLLVHLRFQSLLFVLFVQIVIWITDSGAYFCGRKWGQRKLAPLISPNKTVEGAVGALITALAGAVIYQLIIRQPLFPSWPLLLGTSLLISAAGQLGDLAESAVKRYYMVKDSGRILPGHGGLFDRFDSLIFVLPVLFLIGVID